MAFSKSLLRALLMVVTIFFTTTVHELFHLMVGRAVGIHAQFLSLTSVGIHKSDPTVYPPLSLALMNGMAPVLSFLVFGVFPLYLCARRRFSEPWLSLLGWSAIFNLPYIGLQLMLAVNLSTVTGSGSDMAAVMESLGATRNVRFALGTLGYIVFLLALYMLGRVLLTQMNPLSTAKSIGVSLKRRVVGSVILVLGLLSVSFGDVILIATGNQKIGMKFIALGGFGCIALGAMILISYRNSVFQKFQSHWLIPGVFGMGAMAAFGIVHQNDYADFWLIMFPSVLAVGAVMTNSVRTIAR